ncbi:C-type mannose receptor 2-like [Ruditapes philippinarum]|uniref:C-type mannose receptor 2-like n=1 Tax=Ruditapes philippinarum TaxID=129788 RepID=UPI00295B7651|nr:C-type mannose receptor 2-like [Ruditapes philippinarum]
MILIIFIYLSLISAYVRADFDCLCNYNVEKSVLASASEQSQPIGYMYEFDCKPTLSKSLAPAEWTVIAYEHQTGFVKTDDNTKVQVCPGEVSLDDRLTTLSAPNVQTSTSPSVESTTTYVQTSMSTQESTSTAAVMSTTTTTVKSTTHLATTSETAVMLTTTSPNPTTTVASITVTTDNGNTTGSTLGCPMIVQQSAAQESGTLFINKKDQKCYEMVTTVHSWEYAERDCKSKGGHLATIGDALDEEIVYKYVKAYGHPTWIGLHDMNKEETFEWASGEPVAYLNWHAGRKDIFFHNIEDCVAMGPLTGTWEDMDCLDRYAYICEYVYGANYVPTTPPAGSYTDGNTNMCSASVQTAALHDSAALGQYGRSCYELILHTRVRWEHGESMCKSRGGHLAHIYSADEQGFVQYFMNRHSPQHAVWIGLHDTSVEGQFEWTTGNAVNYTNWIPGHESNFESSKTEDCVAFIPYKNGQWDDIPCGYQFIFGDSGETHPILCQFDIDSAQIIVG